MIKKIFLVLPKNSKTLNITDGQQILDGQKKILFYKESDKNLEFPVVMVTVIDDFKGIIWIHGGYVY